jgi:[ribosomal protein S5]-alanine N-acetyltransferase
MRSSATHPVTAAAFDNEELLTGRLSLRRPRLADVDEILAIHTDPRTYVHNPADALTTRAQAERLYEAWNDQWQRFGFGYWVLRRRDSSTACGFCGVKTMQFKGRRVLNLFVRLDPSAWGQGLASEAASAVVEWVKVHLPEHPIIARVRPENIASQRVAAHAGLVRVEHLDSAGEDGLDWIFALNWGSRDVARA